jgi:hypothetical protein
MPSFQIPKNLKNKPLYLLSLPLENEDGQFSYSAKSWPPSNDNSILLGSNFKDLCKKNSQKEWKVCEGSQRFQDAWTIHLPYLNIVCC